MLHHLLVCFPVESLIVKTTLGSNVRQALCRISWPRLPSTPRFWILVKPAMVIPQSNRHIVYHMILVVFICWIFHLNNMHIESASTLHISLSMPAYHACLQMRRHHISSMSSGGIASPFTGWMPWSAMRCLNCKAAALGFSYRTGCIEVNGVNWCKF